MRRRAPRRTAPPRRSPPARTRPRRAHRHLDHGRRRRRRRVARRPTSRSDWRSPRLDGGAIRGAWLDARRRELTATRTLSATVPTGIDVWFAAAAIDQSGGSRPIQATRRAPAAAASSIAVDGATDGTRAGPHARVRSCGSSRLDAADAPPSASRAPRVRGGMARADRGSGAVARAARGGSRARVAADPRRRRRRRPRPPTPPP